MSTGWVHEQDNLKRVVNNSDSTILSDVFVARELGINRYENQDYFPFDFL